MALLKDGSPADDPYMDVSGAEAPDFSGAVIVSLPQWHKHKAALSGRADPLGIVLASDEKPALIKDDLQHFSVIALQFPTFRDGRAYSHARLLRDRYGYTGELRATGEILLEQLHYMQRVGFNSFAIDSANAVRDWEIAGADLSVWYQPASDQRPTATLLRHKAAQD